MGAGFGVALAYSSANGARFGEFFLGARRCKVLHTAAPGSCFAAGKSWVSGERGLIRAQPQPHVPGKIVDEAYFFCGGARNLGHGHGQLAGKQHGSKRFAYLAANLLFD